MVGLAFSLCCLFFCCMDLYYLFIYFYKQPRKRTQIPQLLIFFNKEYSVFLTFSVLLAGFHLLSSLFLIPTFPPSLLPSLHPHTPTSSSRCDKETISTLPPSPGLNESICCRPWWSFFAETFGKSAVCRPCSRRRPLTCGREVFSGPRWRLVRPPPKKRGGFQSHTAFSWNVHPINAM